MLRRGRRASVAVTAAFAFAFSLILLGPPMTATASTSQIVIDGATSPPSNVGLLSIQAEATSAITQLTVHLIANGTSTDVLDLTISDFTLASGGSTDGIWTVTSPITRGQLPLGTYQVTVDASDQGGDHVTGVNAGVLSFVVIPTVTMAASRTNLDFAHQAVTLTGSVTGLYPDGSVSPLASQPVSIQGYSGTWAATTDSGGHYAVTISPNLQVLGPPMREVLNASVPSSATMAQAASPVVNMTGQAANVQIRVHLSASSAKYGQPVANYGQPVTLSGTAQYQPGGKWKPLANVTIDVTGTDFYDVSQTVPQVTITTDSSGKFAVKLPTQPSTLWTANVQANQYLLQGYTPQTQPNSAFLTVRVPTAFSSPRVRFDPFGDIVASGCLGIGRPLRSDTFIFTPQDRNIELQYSRTATGPWQNVGSLNRPGPSTCGLATPAGGLFGSAVLSGYFRLNYLGAITYEPSVSAVRQASTVRTRFVHFNVTPRSVNGHGRITVSGQLQEQAKGWRSLGPEPIKILIKPHGSNVWYWYKKLRTSSSGRFRISFADPVTGHWAAFYGGNSKHLASVSKIIHVTASGTASASRSAVASRFPAGHQVRMPAPVAHAGSPDQVPAVAPAAPSSGTITVTASSPAASVGKLALAFTATTNITSFTAHIITSSGTDVLDLPQSAFSLTQGTAKAGTWTVNNAITQQQLTLGSYTVTVDATDAGSDQITGVTAGTLNYLIQPTVTLKASPTTIGLSHPTSTVSGTVTGLWPDGSTHPIADELVQSTGPLPSTPFTDASGRFSFTTSFGGTFNVYVQGGDVAPASSPPVTIKANYAPTAITAKLSTSKFSYGKAVTVSGTLTYKPGSAWKPLAGVQVVVSAPGYPQSAPITDSAGHYSATFTALSSGPVTVYFNNVNAEDFATYQWLNPAQTATRTLLLTLPTSVTQFSATVDPLGFVHVSGCIGIESLPFDEAYGSRQPMIIQYSPHPSGPWTRLGKITQLTPNDDSCGITELDASFAGRLPVRSARAYYRAYFPGDASEQIQPSVSPSRLAWKYLTKIKSLDVAPRHVAAGGHIRISGQLLQNTTGWKAFGRQQVLIVYRKPGKKTWFIVASTRTNSHGRFTARVRGRFSAYWSAFYAGDATHYFSLPAGIFVRVG